MNPVILKALIISGGTIGLGVPSIYYGYPHISKLVNPSTESKQESSGEQRQNSTKSPESVTLTQDGQTPKGGENVKAKDNANQAPTENGNDSGTDPKNAKPGTGDSNAQENGNTTNSGRASGGDGAVGGSGTSPTTVTPNQEESQPGTSTTESRSQ